MAIGTKAIATGKSSIAIGTKATASGARSTAIGYGAEAYGDDEIAIGARGSSYRLRGLVGGGGFVESKYQNSGEKRLVTTDNGGTLGTTNFSVNKLLDTIGATGALSAALGALPTTVLLPDETLRCGIGTGTYSSEFAGALGCAVKMKERLFLNAGIAATTSESILEGPMGRLGFSIGFGGSPSQAKQRELSQIPNTLDSLQSASSLAEYGNGSQKNVYSMRGEATSTSSNSLTDNFSNQIALAGEVEKLKHEASAKEDEINQLRIKLENLLNDQAKGTKSPEKSQKQIDHLKDKINILINQLANERASSEAIQDEQDETIAQLRKELEKQKSITERIMKHLGIGKTNE